MRTIIHSVRFAMILAPFLAVFSWPVLTIAQVVPGCGSLRNPEGPFDYRDPVARALHLHVVEEYHFTSDVASLVRGNTGSLIQDLDFTLRAFPNHYRALAAVERYALEDKGHFLADKPAECYFKRAVTFQPDDAVAHEIYAGYLFGCVRLESDTRRRILQCGGLSDPRYMDTRVIMAARRQYEQALRLAPTSPEITYNAALFYLDINEIETARRLAKIAYAGGYPLSGLKERLEAATKVR